MSVEKVLELGRRFGVGVLMLTEGDRPKWPASPSPLSSMTQPLYASFKKLPGTVFLGQDFHTWGKFSSDGEDYSPEVVVLHEIAHSVVGPEYLTVPWEIAACNYLWPDDPSKLEEMSQYGDGAASDLQLKIGSRTLIRLGLLNSDLSLRIPL